MPLGQMHQKVQYMDHLSKKVAIMSIFFWYQEVQHMDHLSKKIAIISIIFWECVLPNQLQSHSPFVLWLICRTRGTQEKIIY